ncbi:hypothetical protein Q8F55_007494 [Vanrija albida]|uniref:C2 domain-containing protein n=1 Tax=Vanrija albida TaxID=181172 RepID=A0ABR3PTP7_9TREE
MIEPQELGTLIVVVARARNLPNKSRFGKQDPYCALTLGEEKRRTKPIKRGGQHPEWDEELRFTISQDVEDLLAASVEASSLKGKNGSLAGKDGALPPLPSEEGVVTPQSMAQKSRAGAKKKAGVRSMKVQCFADAPKEPELVGECIVPIDEVLKKGEIDDWYELKYKDKYAGELYLELTFYSNAAPPVKRNVQRPGVLPATGPGALATPPRPGMTTSVSGYNLYIPPYSQPGRTASPAPGGGIPHSVSGPIPTAQHVGGLPHSNTFHDLGLPPRQTAGVPIPGQPDYPPGRLQSPPQDDFLAGQMGAMSIGQSLGNSYQNRPGAGPPAPATIGRPGHHHRHSVATGAGTQTAPWASMLPQNQQPAGHAPLQRPVSAGDAHGAWPTVDNRPNTAQPLPTRPLSTAGQPPLQSAPLQHHRPHSNSLTVPGSYGQVAPAGHQRTDSYGQPPVSQYTGQPEPARPTSPQSYYGQQAPAHPQQQSYPPQQQPQQQPAYATPPPHRLSSGGSVPPQQPQAPYTPPPQHNRHSSFGQYQAPIPQPTPQPSYPPAQAQQPVYGQHQQQDYPPVPPPAQQLQNQQGPPPPHGTSPAAYPSHLPPQAPRPTTPAAYPPYPPPHPPSPQPHRADSYPNSQSPPSHTPYSPPLPHQLPSQPFAARPETRTPPPAANASTSTGAYVPWFMQTQQPQQLPVQSPPPLHTGTPAPIHQHGHQSSISAAPPPPPSRVGVGYYPSDELYAQQAQPPPQSNNQRPQPQPSPAPQQYQQPQQQQSYPQSPPRQGSYPQAPPRPMSAAPSSSYNPPAPGPNPPAPNPPAPNPPAPSSDAPWSGLQQQQYYPNQQQSGASYYAQHGGDFRPTTAAPDGWDSINGRQAAPSPLPPTGGGTTNRDWRSYLHSIGSHGTPSAPGALPQPPGMDGTPPNQLPPKRASGLPPIPQPGSQQGTPTRQPTNGSGSGEWYTPPPSVPSSILPPGGWNGAPQHQGQQSQQWR